MQARSAEHIVVLGRARPTAARSGAVLGFVLAMLLAFAFAFAFAASASAAEPSGEQPGAAEAPAQSGPANEGPSSASGSETVAPTSAPTEAATQPPPAAEATTVATPPASEETVTTQSVNEEAVPTPPPASEEAAQTTPPPSEEAAQTTPPPSEEAVQTPPPAEVTLPAAEEVLAPVLITEEAASPPHGVEDTLTKVLSLEEAKPTAALEETTVIGHGGSAGQSSSSQAAAATQSAAAAASVEGAGQPFAGALIGSLAGQTEGGGPRLPPPGSAGSGSNKAAVAPSAEGNDDSSCPLASLERRMPGICSSWLGTQRVLSTSSLAAVIAADSSPTQTGTSDGGSHSPSIESAPPASSTPGPPPAGAAGGAAAGGSGMALGFLSLAGLLLLAAPLAMRRLRLSFRLWRASCVALIPERPG
jgi:hypothetical protein